MKLRGEIKSINEKFFTAKDGSETKYLEVHVEQKDEQYPMAIVANVFGDKVENFLKFNKVGAFGDLSINVRVKESKGRLFNSISVWRFDKVEAIAPAVSEEPTSDLPF